MVRPADLVKIFRGGHIFRFWAEIYTGYIQDIYLKIKTRYFEGATSSDLCFKIYTRYIQDIHLKMGIRWLEDIYMIYPKGTYVM